MTKGSSLILLIIGISIISILLMGLLSITIGILQDKDKLASWPELEATITNITIIHVNNGPYERANVSWSYSYKGENFKDELHLYESRANVYSIGQQKKLIIDPSHPQRGEFKEKIEKRIHSLESSILFDFTIGILIVILILGYCFYRARNDKL